MRNQTKWLLGIAGLAILLYFGSYIWLSRRGYAEADEYKIKGFYYFLPENSDAWRYKNYGCMILYWPANLIDTSIGLGRYQASEPLFELANIPKR